MRLYTFYSPIRKGKFRLSQASLNLSGNFPKSLIIETYDGRKIRINPQSESYKFMYFTGEYERAISEVISKIVRKGEICFDIGANIGWYSTLLAKIVGASGEVHAFEPVPTIFEKLKENISLNNLTENIKVNNLALGEVTKNVELNIFENLPEGHASLSDFGRTDAIKHPSKMITLDSYIDNNEIKNVTFLKIDIEGGELLMLKGADKLFLQEIPPMFEIEMALDTTTGFNYYPNDLIEYLSSKRDYDFYAIDESRFSLKKISKINKNDKGANVLCVPREAFQDRIKTLNIK